jgi:hypothetical protein
MALLGASRFGLTAGRGMTVAGARTLFHRPHAHEIFPATGPRDPAKMLLSKIDERLVKLFSPAAEEASGKRLADVAEFTVILSHDDETVAV